MTWGPPPSARPDELALWDALLDGEWPRYAGRRLGIPWRRVAYLCEKWSRKRIYDYGTTCDMGWPEPQPEGWNERRGAHCFDA